MALGDVAECIASHTAWAEDTSDYAMNEFYLGAFSALRKRRCDHSTQACPMESPQMIRTLQWADERRTSNAENELEGELMRGDDHGKNRMEASTKEEDSWTLAKKKKTRTSMMMWSS